MIKVQSEDNSSNYYQPLYFYFVTMKFPNIGTDTGTSVQTV